MSASAGLRELMETYGLKMVRQKIGSRSRVWLLGVMLTHGEGLNEAVSGIGDHIDLALVDYTRTLQGKTIVIEREYPDTCTVTLAANFGEDERGNITGLVPFDEMYDINNPPPPAEALPSAARWLGVLLENGAKVGPLSLRTDRRGVASVNLTIARGDKAVEIGNTGVGYRSVTTSSMMLLSGSPDDIDALTRAWLEQFVPLLRELDMIQEAM